MTKEFEKQISKEEIMEEIRGMHGSERISCSAYRPALQDV